ncbi:MAG: transposase [Actinomycetota bacterium]|nr:transposase [Actinomycetota bacterium]
MRRVRAADRAARRTGACRQSPPPGPRQLPAARRALADDPGRARPQHPAAGRYRRASAAARRRAGAAAGAPRDCRYTEAEAVLRDGELVADAAGQRAGDGKLGKLVAERLAEISLPDLLIEVDAWTGFTERLTPAGAAASRSVELPCVLYAAILAEATNLGLTGMARSSRFTYEQLEWSTDWYLRESTLRDENACLVYYHHALPLTTSWGSGQLSSSDGQRFAGRTRGPESGALPRYFGHRRRGFQMYSWTSDQYSQYDSRVIAANVRDATHTLDGILDNQTALEIEEHTTDTHGYTDMIFAAYDLLDLCFAPRIRDLDRQRLYQHGPTPDGQTSELLRHRLRPELIVPQSDSLFRLAASLKHGWTPASLLLSRLQASAPRNPLARALRSTGGWSRPTLSSTGGALSSSPTCRRHGSSAAALATFRRDAEASPVELAARLIRDRGCLDEGGTCLSALDVALQARPFPEQSP